MAAFFLWDVIFDTGIITRRYPAAYGLGYYQQEEWYAQLLWPILKSRKAGSELSAGGPEVGDGVAAVEGGHGQNGGVNVLKEEINEDEDFVANKKYLYDWQ